MDADAKCRLAVYGSLAPGKSNHHVIADIAGTWRLGWVEGELHSEGWGATQGYPGMIWQPGAGRIEVDLLESPALPQHWRRLDEFEGVDYRRLVVPVHDVRDGAQPVMAHIYVLREAPPRPAEVSSP